MPHPCQMYDWFDPAGSLIQELTEQETLWGLPGWALYYDNQPAYDELVLLEARLTLALSYSPPVWPLQPRNQQPPHISSGNVFSLAHEVVLGLPGDETDNPPRMPSPHAAGPGWLLTPPGDPNWAAINRARELLERVRSALDI